MTLTLNTKRMTPVERKEKVAKLREEHEDYFQTTGDINALYIPKMAYRPSGKDELYVSFFPSEFQKGKDIYTEFVSIEYNSEDPKRTLYLWKHNPQWKDDYELVVSNSGFERHIVPVSELKIISDINSRKQEEQIIDLNKIANLPDPDSKSTVVFQLKRIADSLDTIREILEIKNLR
jgi:hypothetical protein|tara:strand:+ start:107 stop:637 length:531 start_codon:yes stop_codon:yes gene_type:complete